MIKQKHLTSKRLAYTKDASPGRSISSFSAKISSVIAFFLPNKTDGAIKE